MNRSYCKSAVWLFAVMSFLLASCVYEDEKQCPCEVRFVYDYNMEFADAFPQQVGDVKLFIFDSEGKFVSLCQEQDRRPGAGYRMPLYLPAGKYQLVAWAGTAADKSCYNLTDRNLIPGVSTLQDLQLTMNSEGTTCSRQLADLWHGHLTNFEVSPYEPTLATIPLVKNTNRFKILLQDANGQPLPKEDYSFAITDANYSFDYANALLPVPTMTYHPYLMQETVIENDAPDSAEESSDISVLLAEMNTLRLMEDREPSFVVRNEQTGKTIFDINLNKYLDLMRLSSYAEMPLQEFLDRENTWNVILVVGQAPGGAQMMISIQINAWRLIFNETDL